jgi:phospho-N-acetylmuramoyl-pentapeptide-transferase
MERIIYSVLVAFLISLLLGPILIPLLHKMKFGQSIRQDGPQSHLKKAGTPTMGGFIFIFSAIITLSLVIRKPTDEAMIALYAFISFGAIGLIDDFLKIARKKNLGLRAYQKMLLIILVGGLFGYYGAHTQSIGTSIIVPFAHISWDLGNWYIPFIIFFFAATTTGVNLTDGLDGLATSITILVMTFFGIVSFGLGHYTLAIFCGVIVGAMLGFFKYNAYPAKVFMGDTGSLALGGAVAATAMILKFPLLVIIVGGIYVLEVLSDIIQVGYYKLTHKRFFKMAPIHHHFELCGWNETKIVASFAFITVILCFIAFLSL